nr:deoxyribonuclease-2-beta [Pogona vitticeps]
MTVSSLWSLSLLLLGPTLPLWTTGISCINEDGKPVDWYILYKFPKYVGSDVPGSGLEYMFMDALAPTWKRSEYFINMTKSALGQTLQQLYQTYKYKKNNTAYVIYNDGPPNNMNYSWTRGHSKGFLFLDQYQGFWVIHSIPEFPPFPEDGYSYPHTGKYNGQTVICLTFRYDQFAEIDKQLLCYNPNIYNCSIPKAFQLELFNLQMMCAGSEPPPVPWKQRLIQLQSAQGETVFNFAKTHSSHEDIYLDWMAQKLKTDFLIESWHHKGHGLFSNCSLTYHVYNIKQIKIPWNSSFSSYYDHSKWCVSLKPEDRWTCIGDLNYAAQQAKRSGGFVCTQNQFIYKAFRSLVLQYYDCDPSCVYT